MTAALALDDGEAELLEAFQNAAVDAARPPAWPVVRHTLERPFLRGRQFRDRRAHDGRPGAGVNAASVDETPIATDSSRTITVA